MAQRIAPPAAGDSKPRSRTDQGQPDNAVPPPNTGWPFAEGSQNHLDEISAPWPRPSSKRGAVTATRQTPPK